MTFPRRPMLFVAFFLTAAAAVGPVPESPRSKIDEALRRGDAVWIVEPGPARHCYEAITSELLKPYDAAVYLIRREDVEGTVMRYAQSCPAPCRSPVIIQRIQIRENEDVIKASMTDGTIVWSPKEKFMCLKAPNATWSATGRRGYVETFRNGRPTPWRPVPWAGSGAAGLNAGEPCP